MTPIDFLSWSFVIGLGVGFIGIVAAGLYQVYKEITNV